MGSGKLRVGIVGRRGAAYIPGFHASPHTRVEAFCDLDPAVRAQVAAAHGIPHTYPRLREMLDAVDIVAVATPMHLHVPQSLMALQAGKHVLCEVTAAVTLEECWRLLDAVKASGRTYMMAENYCYFIENVLVREMCRRGLFGDLYFAEGEYVHEIRQLHHNPDGSPTWRHYWQVGVPGNTYPTHSVGPVLQWFNEVGPRDRVESVVCLGTGPRTEPEHPHDDTTLTLCKTDQGRLIKLRLDMMSNRPHTANTYTLQGTRGVYESARAPGETSRIWVGESVPGDHRTWRPVSDFHDMLPAWWRNPPPEAREAAHGGGDYWEIRDFVEAVVTGAPPPMDIYTSLEWTAVGLCSQLSIANGGVPIRVPDFRDPAARPITLDLPPEPE